VTFAVATGLIELPTDPLFWVLVFAACVAAFICVARFP